MQINSQLLRLFLTEAIHFRTFSAVAYQFAAAFHAKAELTDVKFGSVAKYNIETLKDEGVGNKLQKQMVRDNGSVTKVYSLDCGHSAYFAKPMELVILLASL